MLQMKYNWMLVRNCQFSRSGIDAMPVGVLLIYVWQLEIIIGYVLRWLHIQKLLGLMPTDCVVNPANKGFIWVELLWRNSMVQVFMELSCQSSCFCCRAETFLFSLNSVSLETLPARRRPHMCRLWMMLLHTWACAVAVQGTVPTLTLGLAACW